MSLLPIGAASSLLTSTNTNKLVSNVITQKLKSQTNNTNKLSDGRHVPGTSKYTGYITGYDEYNANEKKLIEAGLDVESREIGDDTYNHTRSQSTPDYDTDNFKYGLDFKSNLFDYDDPALLGFELFFDDLNNTSPFNTDLTTNKVINFINNYGNIYDLAIRGDLYLEFQKRFFEIFNSLSEQGNNKKKSKNYYITEIKGTDLLNKRIVKYPDDKITITMNEDVSMSAQYLAELYNNIYYSYRNNRVMIPDHLLRFDLYIKVYDIRKFRTYGSGSTETPSKLESKKSVIVYVLHDCNFNFFESKNTEDNINVGGFGASLNTNPAVMSFDIHYKSISKIIEPILKSNSLSIYNNDYDLYEAKKANDDLYFKNEKSDDDLNKWNNSINYKYNNIEKKYGNSSNNVKSALNLTGNGSLINDITGVVSKNVKQLVSNIKSTIISNLKDKRRELLNRFISQIDKKTSLNNLGTLHKLGNVYKGDNKVTGTELEKLSNKIQNDVIRDLNNTRKGIIQGTKSSLSDYIANFDKKLKI